MTGPASPGAPAGPLRLARVIARLNVGGPALHTVVATAGLRPWAETTLLTGEVGPGEAEASAWLRAWGVDPVRVPGLGRAPSPLADVRAYRALVRRFRDARPDVVHTHTAKAGALGRLAARRAGVRRIVHTFHGHVFEGYFGRAVSKAVVAAERRLARITDRVVAVSDEVADDLVDRYRIAPREKVVVIRVGVPLRPFLAVDRAGPSRQRTDARRALGIPDDVPVALLAGRLVPVKEPDLALEAWAAVRAHRPDAVLLVAGDGPLRPALERRGAPGVRFLGWREDLADLWAAADVALLTSRNEGTPVALVEAAAAGVPAVATRVGGVPSVVVDGRTGHLVPPDDAAALAGALLSLLGDPRARAAMGTAARRRATERFAHERMLRDLRELYDSLVRGRS